MKKLHSVIAILMVVLLIFGTTPRSYAVTPTSTKTAQINNLFSRSHDFLTQTLELCNTPERAACHDVVTQAIQHLNSGQSAHSKGNLTGADRTQWLNEHAAYYMQIQTELHNIISNEYPHAEDASWQYHLPAKACLKTVPTWTCDQVMVAATAICSLYFAAPVAGVVLAAICEGASIYGYIQCVNAN